MRASLLSTFLIAAKAVPSFLEVDTVDSCPGAPVPLSFVQTQKQLPGQANFFKCKDQGSGCYQDECCDGQTCVGASDVTQGVCTKTNNALLYCLWTQKGTQRTAIDEFDCDKYKSPSNPHMSACPRVRDPVQAEEWLPRFQSADLIDYEKRGDIECKKFAMKCTWTEAGASAFLVQNKQCQDEDNLPKHCARHGTEVTIRQILSMPSLGAKDASYWERARYAGKENDLMQCTSPQEMYASWATRPVRAVAVMCGKMPYACLTREDAENACRQWSKDPAVPGSGRAELCYKHELGQTVGQNCRYMWTKDSKGKEGCYESNGNFADPEGMTPEQKQAAEEFNKRWDTEYGTELQGCKTNAGIVHCRKYDEPDARGGPETEFPLKVEHQRGFDAACCDEHLPDPYYLFPKN